MSKIIEYLSQVKYLFIFYLTGILYVICPLQIYGSRIQSIFQLCYILWALVLIAYQLLTKRFRFDKMLVLMLCFYIWCWISYLFQPKPHGIIPLKHLLILLMFLALIFPMSKYYSEAELNRFLTTIFKMVVFITVFLNILSIGYYFLRGIIPFPNYIHEKFNLFSGRNGILRYAGIYFHPVLAGEKCFLSIVFSILLHLKKKLSRFATLLTLLSSGAMIILADPRTTYLQLLFVSAYVAYQLLETRRGKRSAHIFLVISIFIVVAVLLYFIVQSNQQGHFHLLNQFSSNRLIIWKTAVKAALKRPWLGWGWENSDSIVIYTQSGIENCHNIIVNLLLWTGAPGLILFLIIIILWSMSIIKNWLALQASNYHWLAIITVALFIQSLLDILIIGDDLRIGTPFFWLFAGIAYYVSCKSNMEQDSSSHGAPQN